MSKPEAPFKTAPDITEHPYIAAMRSLHSMPRVQFIGLDHPLTIEYNQVIEGGRAMRERVLDQMRRRANDK